MVALDTPRHTYSAPKCPLQKLKKRPGPLRPPHPYLTTHTLPASSTDFKRRLKLASVVWMLGFEVVVLPLFLRPVTKVKSSSEFVTSGFEGGGEAESRSALRSVFWISQRYPNFSGRT